MNTKMFSPTMISDNLFGELVKRRGAMNWALVAPLFWAPLLPLTRIAASKAPPALRLQIYLGTASLGDFLISKHSSNFTEISFVCIYSSY